MKRLSTGSLSQQLRFLFSEHQRKKKSKALVAHNFQLELKLLTTLNLSQIHIMSPAADICKNWILATETHFFSNSMARYLVSNFDLIIFHLIVKRYKQGGLLIMSVRLTQLIDSSLHGILLLRCVCVSEIEVKMARCKF